MPTIKDIALAAGVSHATVSNVLNKKGNVSSEKIRLVEAAARSLGYRIDEQASLLRKGITRIVAVILPEIQSSRYCDLYVGILRILEQRGYSARLFLTENIPNREHHAIHSAIAAKACAILTVSCLENAAQAYQVPSLSQTHVLFLEREPEADAFPTFSFNYEKAGEFLALKAKENGSDLPGIFLGDLCYSSNRDFLKGIRKVYPQLLPNQMIQLKCGDQSTDAYIAFQQETSMDCYITSNSEIAQQLLSICRPVRKTQEPPVFSLSSLRARTDKRFNSLAFNYSRLGLEAAQAIIGEVEQGAHTPSRKLDYSCYLPVHPSVSLSPRKPLRMLSLISPTAHALECLLPEFTRQTGIQVELETQPLGRIFSCISQDTSLDYDVIRLDVSSFDHMAPKLLTPLTDLDASAGSYLKRFIPGLESNYCYVGDVLYALPFDVSIQMLFYRKDLFENTVETRRFFEDNRRYLKVPETFEEYNEIARYFTRSCRRDSPTAYGTSISLGNTSSASVEYLVRLLGMGGDIFDEDGLLHISSPTAKKALESYLESASYADPAVVHSWGAVADRFVRGDLAMAILFVNHASHLIQAQNTLSSNQVGFAPVPGSRPLLGGGSLGICASSQQKEEAYRLIQWATGEEIAARLMIMGGISPCLLAYENIEVLNTYPWLEDLPRNMPMGSRKTILSNSGLHLDVHAFEGALGKLIIDAAAGKRGLDETIWRAQMVIEEMGGHKI